MLNSFPDKRSLIALSFFVALAWIAYSINPVGSTESGAASTRPNILLIVFEDMSARVGSYGDAVATTPVLDEFASQALLFERAFTTAGVCAPSRAALITGRFQQTIGTHQMRTRAPFPGMDAGGPINYDAVPPADVKAFPELLRAAGYYTTNNGKTDYQFGQPFTIWDEQSAEHPWRNAPKDSPFFAMVNILQTHESYVWPTDKKSNNQLVELVRQRNLRDLAEKVEVTDPASVTVPPYLPDTEAVRQDIARHYDNIAFAEKIVADLLEGLAKDGHEDNTIVIITTDHGDGLPRMKRSLYDSGIHVPMMVRFPSGAKRGERTSELVSFVDIAPTLLSLAGVERPDSLPGRVFLGAQAEPSPDYIYAAADRHDNVPDRVRAVRDQRYKYIRNYVAGVPFFRPLPFRDIQPTMQALWGGYKEGSLTPVQAQYFESAKPTEELYDLDEDPHEIRNVAGDPKYAAVLDRMRGELDKFQSENLDMGVLAEADMISDMWPGMRQPETSAPEGSVIEGNLVLRSPTKGASIGYRLLEGKNDESVPWQIYVGPISVSSDQTVEAKAIRYGFAESEVTRILVP